MFRPYVAAPLALLAALALPDAVEAQSRVQYGRVTQVQPVTSTEGGARVAGSVVGGTLGLMSGSGQSSSNRALRGIAGATAGRAVGSAAGQSQSFEYTVLVGGSTTIRIVSDQAGKRVGDCVSVEQGQFANIRLVSDDRCATRPQPAASSAQASTARPPAPPAADVQRAGACDKAKAQVLAANTDEEFGIAERRMRLLCGE